MNDAFRVPALAVESDKGMRIPLGPTNTRPTGTELEEAMFRLNSETKLPEYYLAGVWYSLRQEILDRGVVDKATTIDKTGSYGLDTTGAGFTVTLKPKGEIGERISFYDYANSWDSRPVTVSSTGKLEGSEDDILLNTRGSSVEFVYADDIRGWVRRSGYSRPSAGVLRNWVTLTTGTAIMLTVETGYRVELAPADTISLTLPTVNVPLGSVIYIVDTNATAENQPIIITSQSGNINGATPPFLLSRPRGAVECVYVGDDNGWMVTYVMGNTVSTVVAGTPVTSNVTLRSGTWYRCEQSGPINPVMPQSAKAGDTVVVFDALGTADVNPITLQQGADGAYIDRVNAPLIINQRFALVELVFTGNNAMGWVITSAVNFKDHRGVTNHVSSSSVTPDFSNNNSVATVPIDRNVTINPPIFQANPNVVTTFYLILKVDTIGNYAVAIPDVTKGWKPAVGSSPLRIDAKVVNVIQGIHLNGEVYYTITNHRAA